MVISQSKAQNCSQFNLTPLLTQTVVIVINQFVTNLTVSQHGHNYSNLGPQQS